LIALLAPDRRENTFSRLSFTNPLFEFVEFLKRNLIERPIIDSTTSIDESLG
jgi:hypothetical protein